MENLETVEQFVSRKDIDANLIENTSMRSFEGLWRGHRIKCFDFKGNLVQNGKNWLAVGTCTYQNATHPSQYTVPWSMEYDNVKDTLLWECGVGSRSHLFKSLSSNSDISYMADPTSGVPLNVLLRTTVPRFLNRQSFLSFS